MLTARLKSQADRWRDIRGLSQERVEALIRQDRVDILVDLAGHTTGNRMPLFARKPAPIQVSYLGYPNTSGLDAMDYRITDAHADPVGQTDHLHAEDPSAPPHCSFPLLLPSGRFAPRSHGAARPDCGPDHLRFLQQPLQGKPRGRPLSGRKSWWHCPGPA